MRTRKPPEGTGSRKKRRKRKVSPEVISVKEIVQRVRVSKTTIYRMLHLGVLPAIRTGEHSFVIPRRAFDDWFASGGRFIPDVVLRRAGGDDLPDSAA